MRSLLATLLLMLYFVPFASGQLLPKERESSAQASAQLRQMVFALRLKDLGLIPETYPHHVWGVVMETGLQSGGFFSLVVLADGTTSIYVSKGGGILGTGENPSVAKASSAMLAESNQLSKRASPATSTPPPDAGAVYFYFLTKSGTASYRASQSSLAERLDPLSTLFFSGHEVISAVTKASGVEQMPR